MSEASLYIWFIKLIILKIKSPISGDTIGLGSGEGLMTDDIVEDVYSRRNAHITRKEAMETVGQALSYSPF